VVRLGPDLEMAMYTRREFGQLTLAGLTLPRLGGLADSRVGGVRLGVQTYSFRDLPRADSGDAIDAVIKATADCGLGECELFAPQIEPRVGPVSGRGAPVTPEVQQARQRAREDLRAWRLETPLDHFRAIKKKFEAAGISIYAYNYSFGADMRDEEIDRGFEMTRALGASIITASTNLTVAKRVVPFAEKHRMVVAMHGHSNRSDPNEFCTPESFGAAMKMSEHFKVNLDIGHFTAADFDAIAYIREHHADITNLHLKDRKRHQGDNVPWGQGDTPIREVLLMLKREKWPIPAYIEYEYRGAATSTEEVKKCFQYAKQILA
jgi:sugar phosphate isomerase/epimerase